MKTFGTFLVSMYVVGSAFAESLVFESSDTQTTLVELFTSEGCSSCPPAEAWMSKLKKSPNLWTKVVPVAFHVDYWDNLGWSDSFASRAYTERQRHYTSTWKIFTLYTPGFVLNGREWRSWSPAARLEPAAAAKAGKLRAALHDGTRADIRFEPISKLDRPPRVEVVLLGAGIESDVKRGENGGRKLQHDFVVLHHAGTAMAADGANFQSSLLLPENLAWPALAFAAWVTLGESQPVLQATGGWIAQH